MIKLRDAAMAIERCNASQPVVLRDKKSHRICFEGVAENIVDYSGIDHKKVVGMDVKDGVLLLYIENSIEKIIFSRSV